MKYEKEIKTIFSLFYDDWMDEDDKANMDHHLLKYIGKTIEELSEDIDTGIKNGYSIKDQLNIIYKLFG